MPLTTTARLWLPRCSHHPVRCCHRHSPRDLAARIANGAQDPVTTSRRFARFRHGAGVGLIFIVADPIVAVLIAAGCQHAVTHTLIGVALVPHLQLLHLVGQLNAVAAGCDPAGVPAGVVVTSLPSSQASFRVLENVDAADPVTAACGDAVVWTGVDHIVPVVTPAGLSRGPSVSPHRTGRTQLARPLRQCFPSSNSPSRTPCRPSLQAASAGVSAGVRVHVVAIIGTHTILPLQDPCAEYCRNATTRCSDSRPCLRRYCRHTLRSLVVPR